MKFSGRDRPVILAAAMAAAVGATGAAAQDQATNQDAIVVTATKREQTLQDVPFSVNAQTQADIQRTGSQNLEDLSRNVAGLAIQNLGPGQSQVGIRGVSAGQIVRDQPGVKEQVGIYLDESVISLSLFTPDLDLFDLARVETLRGPQGTLFGSGSVGGTIRFITNQPKLGAFEGALEGNVNVIDGGGVGGHAKGMLNIPMGDKMALRVVAYDTEYGGFLDAQYEDGRIKKNINSGERSGVRAALRWEPADMVTITPRFVYQRVDVHGFNRHELYNLFANPFTTTRPPVDFSNFDQHLLLREEFKDNFYLGDLTIELKLGGVNFTSVTSYTDRQILVSRDASALTGSVSVDLGYPDVAVSIPSNLRDTTDLTQLTQEARFSSNYESPLQWVVGLFYADAQRDYAQRLPTPGYDYFTDLVLGAGTAAATANGYGPDSPYNSDLPYHNEQFAVFGEGTYDLTDKFHVTAGARYYDFHETRRFVSGGLFSNGDNRTDSTSSNGFSPRFILSYDATDAITFNAQASKGFRLGGVNDPLNLTLCSPQDAAIFGSFQDYNDETLWNYEGGMKVRKGAFSLNAAGFYTDISNLQVTLDAGSCSSRISFNVPKAHTAGFEWELQSQPITGLEFSFSGTILNAEFDSTVVDGMGNVVAGLEKGNRLASVPKLQLAASAQYNFPIGTGNGFIAASVQHIGDRFTQPSDQVNSMRSFVSGLPFLGAPGTDATVVNLDLPAYTIVNLNAGYTKGAWDFLVYVNNVGNEEALLSFDRERGGRARLAYHVNQPRTFGVTARVHF
ncbi:MAG: TonB-dependent receptor [Alphaproteobacteria bacterium]|nr:TonB-dependent receptor [Alphaproteobacteria bacterium]